MSIQPASILDLLSDRAQLLNFAKGYNKRLDKVPKILRYVLGEERVNIKITLEDGEVYRLGYRTEKGMIVEIYEAWLKDPTIIVATTQKVIEEINAAADPLAAFKKRRASRALTIEGQSMATRMKLDAALSSDSVLWFFYNALFG